MDTLPPEVYSQIVQVLRPTGKRNPRNVLPVEVIFSHVSSGWRRLAFSDSTGWEVIEIYSPKTLPRGEAYAARSAGAAIHLRIDLYDYECHNSRAGSRRHKAFIARLATLLQSAAPRCKSILIFTYHEQTAMRLSSALETTEAPLLQSVRIEANDSVEETLMAETEAEISLISIFKGTTPSLRSAWLETPAFPPLQQLSTLYLHSINADWFTFDEFARIIAEAPILENLSLSSRGWIQEWPQHHDASAITIPSLRSLKISGDYPGLTVKALLSIGAPNLTSLVVWATSSTFLRFFDTPQFQNQPEGSLGKFPKLEYLTLQFYDMHNANLFAKAFPTITHLRLSYPLVFSSNRFGADLSGAFLWPKMGTLVLEVDKDTHGARLREACCTIATSRKLQNLPVPKFLGDKDVLRVLGASDYLNEVAEMGELTDETYAEFWWRENRRITLDRIGVS
ncbi:hypothetical protein DFP72DRAFT_883528 [Ephemerocybe angulata]|uniref:F-box domain-containing protein n=1 Tax=Ephemerocybe angulata TaxID=980116 RepID=A0A8H6I785_9AGAR|nr:hypothetical protein DFP72DRAFT_883528 [Tulosesus angulatus]